MERKGTGFLIPCATLVAGVYWLYTSVFELEFYGRNGPQTGFFPAVVAILMIVVSILLLFQGREPKKDFQLSQLLPVAGIIGVVVVGLLIGVIPALFIFVFTWFFFFEKYSLRFSLTISVVSILIIWLVFDKGVGVSFEQGLIGEWFTE